MTDKDKYEPRQEPLGKNYVLFDTVEEALFWFIQAQQAKDDGARYSAGLSLKPRPCEPGDILKVLHNLYRNRLLMWDHMLVLRHYGQRQMAPDARRAKELKAYKLWHELIARVEPILIRKNILVEKKATAQHWAEEAVIYANMQSNNADHHAS